MLIDTSKCMACRACQVACKQWNQLPAEDTKFEGTYENPLELSHNTWTKVGFKEAKVDGKIKWFFSKQGCMHCGDAACISICPAGAISRTNEDSVVVDHEKCINCGYCRDNCPFQVVGWDQDIPHKCTFCDDRVSKGQKPACASTCPTGAVVYGDRDELIIEAEERVEELKAQGKNAQLYGVDEFGGKGMGRIYVLEDSPAYYGFMPDPKIPLTTRIWGTVFKPVRVMVAGLVAIGVLASRAESLEVKEAKEE